MLNRNKLDRDELTALVVEIEAIMNDRPLTYVPSEINEPNPITPSQLFQGRRISTVPYPIVDVEDIRDADFNEDITRSRAKHRQHFVKRWQQECLTALRESHARSGTREISVKIGDVVLIHNDGPRIAWKLATVTKLNFGADNIVRSVQLKMATGVTNRPLIKSYPLEIRADRSFNLENRSEDDDSVREERSPRPQRRAAEIARQRIRQTAEHRESESD
ncbi:uncharacterized protein LOC141911541 [Tubulanus polymorphus]|uniref:uncharacterized protein LOC141911537 n=1 Tax=Tubulanus polymorphus TaxID=672921 RepID=UPI003DA63A74